MNAPSMPAPSDTRTPPHAHARSPATARIVVRATLRSRVHLPRNRRLAQELAWAWVRAKWPRLLPSPAEMERRHFERSLPGQALSVDTSDNGAVWTLTLAHGERHGSRTWITRAQVLDAGDADVLALQTACSDPMQPPLVVAPPRLLGAWVERLELEDAGLAVLGEPHQVQTPEQLAAFQDHVLSLQRSLPVIALANKPGSRYYGVDPRGLAEAVRGLAHVACLTPELADDAADRLGQGFGLVPGAARIFAPGFRPGDLPSQHPLVRDRTPPAAQDPGAAKDAGAFRRQLCRRVCEISTHSGQVEDAQLS